MSEATQDLIGKVLHQSGDRDAIHIAVYPAVASVKLSPGQHVGIVGDKAIPNDRFIGIVDPFLKETVREGQRFFIFLYPNTISGLRHVWRHPVFDHDEAERKAGLQDLCEYASREGLSIDELLSGLHYGYENGGEVCYPSDINYGVRDEEAREVWMAYTRYTGKPMPDESVIETTRFRCAC